MLPPLAPGQVIRIGPDRRNWNADKRLRHRRHRSVRVHGVSRAGSCRSAVTASPARASASAAGMHRSRCTSKPTRSTTRPVCATTGVTGNDKPLLADSTPAGHVAAARGRGADQPGELPARHHRQGPGAADVATGESQSGDKVIGRRCRIRSGRGDYDGGEQSQISGYYDPIPKPDSPTRLGVHRRQQLRPQRTSGALPARSRRRSPTAPVGRAGLLRAAGASHRRRCGRIASAR